MSIFAFQLIRFVCRGTSFSFWVAIRLSEHARARSVFPAARPIFRCWIAQRIAALASLVTGAIRLPASLRFHCICFRRSTTCSSKSIGVRGSSMKPVGSRFRVCRIWQATLFLWFPLRHIHSRFVRSFASLGQCKPRACDGAGNELRCWPTRRLALAIG